MDQPVLAVEVSIKEWTQAVYSAVHVSFPIVFGRGGACHISLPKYSFLSKTHGCIFAEGDSLVLADSESKNGIMVNSELITSRHFDDEISFVVGTLQFKVRKVQVRETQSRARTIEFTQGTATQIDLPVELESNQIVPRPPPPAPPPLATRPPLSAHANKDRRAVSRTAFSDIETEIQHLSLRAVIFWQNDVFDVRQFLPGDSIFIGCEVTDPLVLPTRNSKLFLGRVDQTSANIVMPMGAKWRGESLSGGALTPKDPAHPHIIKIEAGNLLKVELEPDLMVQFSFCELTRPFLSRTWIENKEEFKVAVRVSSVIHTLICLSAIFGAPKPTAPKIDNMEVRFARLLVEPPKQIMAAQPPKPPPPPPEPPKEEPPKIATKIPRKKLSRKMAKSQVRMKKTSNPRPAPPLPNQADQLLSALDSFSALTPPQTVNIKDLRNEAPAENNFLTSQMMKTLKSKSGKLANQPSTDMNSSLSKSAKYRNIAGQAGARQIQGAVVGRPHFDGSSGPQGLTNKEVMAAVNKHVGEIQQCYERALLENSTLNGRVEYEWTIAKSGTVTDAQVKKSDVSGGDALNDCVTGVLRKILFPAAKNGQPTVVSIGFPFGRE